MFTAMGTEPRLRIMQLLLSAHPDGLVVGEIQEELDIPNSTLSHHLDKLKAEDLVQRAARKDFPALHSQYGFPAGIAWISLRGVLHTQQSNQARANGSNLQIGADMSSPRYQGRGQGKIRRGGSAGQGWRQFLLRGKVVRAPAATRSPPTCTTRCRPIKSPKRQCSPLWDAAIRPHWRKLNPGEVVLDLGSGGGIDVLLSAKRVGPAGKAYGLDMTDEMLAIANKNKRKSGLENVEFLKGEIEHIPLPDNSVDVVISNCVINLSADKDRVMREAFRVLKPGGRFAVSDVVTRGEMLPEIRKNVLLWFGCVAGALEEEEYRSKLASAGFEQIDLEPTRVYRIEDAREFLSGQNIDVDAIAPQVDGKFMSAFVRAVKPLGSESCCAPTCCN